ncbi:hypothetical protein AKJ09_01055 [Labilithrix luteola]|uniref:DUF4340 domain-containing protein n=1 Tax=Labilithrix luteola TaxID=1391654 RepID=A0A0K1PLX2_9BACT|nr:DUF4340 domain-containing protein [Labilithrix luteola]AKU94391.1 hypothetical protein AKJ09_01055 [Labilithrix luteola]
MNALRKHATTIVLVALAAGLGGYFFVDRDRVTEGERKSRENNAFSAWRREELSRIEIVHDGDKLVLERDAKKDAPWRMVSPHEGRSDQAAVDRLITTLEFATAVRKATEGPTLGLDEPRVHGSITMGGLVQRFALGAPSPRPEGSSYFRVNDGAPFVVSKETSDALLQSSDTYRDRSVVPYLSLELDRFEVARPAARAGFALERIDDHAFRVASEGVLASRDTLERVWGALAEMRASVFPNDADADRLTAEPVATIRMVPKDKDKPPAELVIGGPCPTSPNDVVVLRKAPTRVAACAPKSVLEALSMSPKSLVDKRPFSFNADEIEELILEWQGGQDAGAAPAKIEIARKGTGFHARAPFDRDLSTEEADAASELVSKIATAEGDSAVPSKGQPPFTPVAKARVRSGDFEQIVEIGPIAKDSKLVPVHRLADDARLEVPPAVARLLVPRETSLRPRPLLGETRKVTRVLLRCGTPQELVDTGEGFRFVEPKGYEADGSLSELVSALTRGKVDAWVSDTADDPAFGLEGSHCRVFLGFEGGNDPKTVLFGAQVQEDGGEGGVYGQVEGRPEVFVAPKSMLELLSRNYVSRALLRVPADLGATVSVTYEGKPVTKDPAELRDALAALYADRVTSFTPENAQKTLLLEVTTADSGPRKRIACGPNGAPAEGKKGEEWLCTTSGVSATFAVSKGKISAFLPGNLARDGGSR